MTQTTRQILHTTGLIAAAATLACGPSAAGPEGPEGPAGPPALIKVNPMDRGTACEFGGLQVVVGSDLDGDGELSVSEITGVENVCNGSDGADGMDGVDGMDGMDGGGNTNGGGGQPANCAEAAPIEITAVDGIANTYFRGFAGDPITVSTNSNAAVEFSFVSTNVTFEDGPASNQFVPVPNEVGGGFGVVVIATDGCTLDTANFTIPRVERSVTDVRFVHLFDGAGDVEVTLSTEVDPIALLAFEDSSEATEYEAGTFTYDVRDLDTGAVIATTPPLFLAPQTSNTILMYRDQGGVAFALIEDDVSTPPRGDMRVRAFHAADGVGRVDALIEIGGGTFGTLVADVDPNTASAAITTGAINVPVVLGLDTTDDFDPEFRFQAPSLDEGDVVNVFAYLDGARPKLYLQFLSEETTSRDAIAFSYNGSIEIEPGDELIPSAGMSTTLTGTLDASDPQWARPSASCFSGSGTKYFDAVPFTNATLAPQTLDLDVAWSGVDGFLHVFRSAPDPTNPTRGCLDGNDDSGGTSASRLGGYGVAPGERVWIVLSTFSDDDTGGWTLEVTSSL
jgi:hypothetical protein